MMWLEWVGWGGISGVVSLVALVAALAVTYLEVRAWWLSPRTADVNLRITVGGAGIQGDRLIFAVRVTEPTVLNEVTMQRVGGGAGPEKLGDTVAVLDARDGEVERTTWRMPHAPPVYFFVSWYERNRFGSRIQSRRMRWPYAPGIERWKPYTWPFFRKTDGRWVREKEHPGRGMTGIYWPVEETDTTPTPGPDSTS